MFIGPALILVGLAAGLLGAVYAVVLAVYAVGIVVELTMAAACLARWIWRSLA